MRSTYVRLFALFLLAALAVTAGCDSGSTGTPVDGDTDLTGDADPDDAEEICAECGDTEEEEDAQADGDADGDREYGEEEDRETEDAIEYPSHKWSFSVGGDSVQTVKALAADPAGNVYLGGDFDGSITMCGETITSGDGADMFLMKVDINGTCQWIRHYCTVNCMGMLSDVKLDGDQNPVITGTFSGTIDLGGDVLGTSVLPSYNVFLANISAGGEHIWSHWYDGSGAKQSPGALAVASDGVIHLTGEMAGAVDFGGGILHSAGESDVFVAAFTPGGAFVDAMSFGNALPQAGGRIAVDDGGNVYVTGMYQGEWEFCDTTLGRHGVQDFFLVKFDDSGSCAWIRQYGSDGTDRAGALALDASAEHVYVAGAAGGSLDYGGGPLPFGGASDAFIVKIAADGSYVWSRQIGDNGNQSVRDLLVEADGSLWLTGGFSGVMDWGDNAVLRGQEENVFLANLDAEGTHIRSWSFGSMLFPDSGICLAADGQGHLFLAGTFNDTINLGGETLESAYMGDIDIFLASFTLY